MTKAAQLRLQNRNRKGSARTASRHIDVTNDERLQDVAGHPKSEWVSIRICIQVPLYYTKQLGIHLICNSISLWYYIINHSSSRMSQVPWQLTLDLSSQPNAGLSRTRWWTPGARTRSVVSIGVDNRPRSRSRRPRRRTLPWPERRFGRVWRRPLASKDGTSRPQRTERPHGECKECKVALSEQVPRCDTRWH